MCKYTPCFPFYEKERQREEGGERQRYGLRVNNRNLRTTVSCCFAVFIRLGVSKQASMHASADSSDHGAERRPRGCAQLSRNYCVVLFGAFCVLAWNILLLLADPRSTDRAVRTFPHLHWTTAPNMCPTTLGPSAKDFSQPPPPSSTLGLV